MNQVFGPPLITDGLVAYYDIYNSSCYISGSSTLYDLSGNNNHATLIGSPEYIEKSSSYNNNPVKLLGFNGVDQYVTMSNSVQNVKTQMFWLNMASPYNLSVTDRFGENIYIMTGSLDNIVLTNLNNLGTSNYILNGEFGNDIADWKDIDGNDPATWNADDDTYPDASPVRGSLDITFSSDPRTSGVYYNQIILENAVQSFIVSFWYKTVSLNDGINVYLIDDPFSIGTNPKVSAKLELSSGWTNATILFDTGFPVNNFYLIFAKTEDIGSGVFSLDGVSVYPVDYFYENNIVQPESYQHITTTSDYGFTVKNLMGTANPLGSFYTGSVSQIMLYDRKLSEDELKRNADAFKTRYKTY